eukprot:757041-Hanusia_phi.AAC.1
MPVKVAINGAGGRMGRRLLVLSSRDADVELVQAIEYSAHPMQGKVTRLATSPPLWFLAACEIVGVTGVMEEPRRESEWQR